MARVAWEWPKLRPRRIHRQNVAIPNLQQHQQPLRREPREQRGPIRERAIEDLIARTRAHEPHLLSGREGVGLRVRDTLRPPTRNNLLPDPLLRLGVEDRAIAERGVQIAQHRFGDFDREPRTGLAAKVRRAAVAVGDGGDDGLAVAMRVPETKGILVRQLRPMMRGARHTPTYRSPDTRHGSKTSPRHLFRVL